MLNDGIVWTFASDLVNTEHSETILRRRLCGQEFFWLQTKWQLDPNHQDTHRLPFENATSLLSNWLKDQRSTRHYCKSGPPHRLGVVKQCCCFLSRNVSSSSSPNMPGKPLEIAHIDLKKSTMFSNMFFDSLFTFLSASLASRSLHKESMTSNNYSTSAERLSCVSLWSYRQC